MQSQPLTGILLLASLDLRLERSLLGCKSSRGRSSVYALYRQGMPQIK